MVLVVVEVWSLVFASLPSSVRVAWLRCAASWLFARTAADNTHISSPWTSQKTPLTVFCL